MIIGINGRIGSGKDTVGKIIQYLIYEKQHNKDKYFYYPSDVFINVFKAGKLDDYPLVCGWEIKKFADALKECASIILGIPRKDFEIEKVKSSELTNEWSRITLESDGKIVSTVEDGVIVKQEFDTFTDAINYHKSISNTEDFICTANKLTVRRFLQLLGTESGRAIHPNIWVNTLMKNYSPNICSGRTHCALAGKPEISCNKCPEYPNWIITDVRFPNEYKAVKDRGGIMIKVIKLTNETDDKVIAAGLAMSLHSSETALDNHTFDYTITAKEGDIESLINQTREILIKEKIL